VERYTEVFVGIDVAKARNAIAVADGARGGEVRFVAYRSERELVLSGARRIAK
jgi:hypothetical protein